MQHRFAIALLQLFCIVSSARASWHGCFVTDTTWAANTNQGFVNVTSKVIIVYSLESKSQSNLISCRRNVNQFAKNPRIAKDLHISMEKLLPMPTSARPSQPSTPPSHAQTVSVDLAPVCAQVHNSKAQDAGLISNSFI